MAGSTGGAVSTYGGFQTYDLRIAKEEHFQDGGFLLMVGANPPLYAVCTLEQAVRAALLKDCRILKDGQKPESFR